MANVDKFSINIAFDNDKTTTANSKLTDVVTVVQAATIIVKTTSIITASKNSKAVSTKIYIINTTTANKISNFIPVVSWIPHKLYLLLCSLCFDHWRQALDNVAWLWCQIPLYLRFQNVWHVQSRRWFVCKTQRWLWNNLWTSSNLLWNRFEDLYLT